MLPDSFTLEVVTPEHRVVRATAVEAQIPASDGYIGVLPGHAPLLSAMGQGELSYRDGNTTHYVAVFGGYVEVLSGRVIVLAEAAERAEEIDVDRARASKDRSEKTAATPGMQDDIAATARASAARADIRIQVAGRAQQHAGAGARHAAHAA
jgi:F-type H+-transporting ATPase subunit epsilon